MKKLHRKVMVSGLLCLLLCGKALSTSMNEDPEQNVDLLNILKQRNSKSDSSSVPNIVNSENMGTSESPPSNKDSEVEHILIRTSTLTVHSMTPNMIKKEHEEGQGTSLTLMLAMIGVAVGTACAIGTVAVIVFIKRKTTNNKEVSRKIAQRTNMYVIRNDNYDLNKTLSGIPSATDIWREIKIDT